MLPLEFEATYMASTSEEERDVVLQIAGDWCEEHGDLASAELCRGKASIPLGWCPAGQFRISSPENEKGCSVNKNQVDVTMTQGYWLGKYPVTQGQWYKVMGTTIQEKAKLVRDSVYGEGPNYPMYYVSWKESREFCKRYTESERQAGRLPKGWAYKLPTAAQWEYACRAGSTTRFCFGDDEAKLGEYARRIDNSNEAHEVCQKQPNAWGLYDINDNVAEWRRDWDARKLYSCLYHGGLDRGSSSFDYRDRCFGACFCLSRVWFLHQQGSRSKDLGFRLALVR